MDVIKGIPVSPGVVIGHAFVLDEVYMHVPQHRIREAEVASELSRLENAISKARTDLEADRDRVAEKLGPEPAKIFDFHLGLLHDSSLLDPIQERVSTERVTASYAVSEAFRGMADQFRAMGSEVFRLKASDVLDLDRRLLAQLSGQSRDRLARVTEPVILIAHELTPTEAASLDVTKVIGFATDAGGRTGHTSIVAAALGIPVIVGSKTITLHVDDGDRVIIDGNTGTIIVDPDDETIAQYELDIERLKGFRAGLRELASLESETSDGTHIHLLGNIEFESEIPALLEKGGEGVGLFRTEFLYLTSLSDPTEDELYESYKIALEMLNGAPMTLRTLDLGADKHTQQQAEEPERNPFLGLRSIRYCLQNLPIFRTQLRAILRASAHGTMKVMFPLISTAMELRQAKMIFTDVMEECEDENIEFDHNIEIGMMIEVPSAALLASTFAQEVSFFSIGTNDLIQYTLAVDRGNERVASLYCPANPAVIMLIKNVIRVGKRFKIQTSLCGEIAGETLYTMLLIGLGLRTLSLVPAKIPEVKRVIRSVDIATCKRLARKVGSFDSERQVLNCLRDELRKALPDADVGWSGG